jgi:hypothetical protein
MCHQTVEMILMPASHLLEFGSELRVSAAACKCAALFDQNLLII